MALRTRLGATLRTLGLVVVAFSGGAVASRLADARPGGTNPYAPFDQMARVLVLIEKEYVEPASRTKVTDGAIKGMVAELDPHSAYMPPADFSAFQGETEGKFGGIGVEVDYRDDFITIVAPIDGSPASRAGILPGDQVWAVDGKPMRGERIEKMVGLMRGAAGTKVRLSVRRPGVTEPMTFDLVREEIHISSIVARRMAGDVAYVRLKQFQDGTHDELLRAAAKLRSESSAPIRGVLLDMRNNPGGLVDEAEAVADEFLASGTIYTTRRRGLIVDEVRAHDGGAFATVPVVTLVNEYSASAAELLAGALQDNGRTKIVGANTFGKGSVQTIFDLPGGAGLRLTTMRYYTPSGRSIQAEGIKPDVLIQWADSTIVRERDLEGHLPAETHAAAPTGQTVVQGSGKRDKPVTDRDIPNDPRSSSSDFTLSTGYKLLLKSLGG
jgi:carboxyl-terminal processing protease